VRTKETVRALLIPCNIVYHYYQQELTLP